MPYRMIMLLLHIFFFSSRRRHTRFSRDWSSDVCSSDLGAGAPAAAESRASYKADPVHSSVVFNIEHAGAARFWGYISEVSGDFELSSDRSEERRVGKESRSRLWSYETRTKNEKKKTINT